MSVGQVVAEVAKDQIFFDESGGGITLSGGEPLMQPLFVELLLAAVKARRIGTVLETCGFADPGLMRRVSRFVDLFLYDLKLVDSDKHRQFTGVPNEVILGNLKMLAAQGCAITVRVPLIPGVNDDSKNVSTLSEFLSSVGLREIDLLPYHRIGSSKYDRLHMSDRMMTVEPPSAEQMEALAARLRRDGFRVRIGG
jgi:pyruvate formate lyase activating enzyme